MTKRTRRPSPSPPAVLELAASCVRFVASRYGVALDFTQDTLPVVDQYVRDAQKEIDQRPEALALVAASVGAYLGEVMRRSFGAFWFADGEYSAWRLHFTRVYLACNPLGMVLEALAPEEAEGWHAHFEIDPGGRGRGRGSARGAPRGRGRALLDADDAHRGAHDCLRGAPLAHGRAEHERRALRTRGLQVAMQTRAMVLEKPAPIPAGAARSSPARSAPDPTPGPEIVFGVAACGVCRTDLQLGEGDLARARCPIVPGHQIVGRVVAVGAGVTALRVGDRAGVALARAARAAPALAAARGARTSARDARSPGWDRDGGYATHAIVARRLRAPLARRVRRPRRRAAALRRRHRLSLAQGERHRARRAASASTASARRRCSRSRSRVTGAAASSCARAPDRAASARARSAPSGPAATTSARRSRSTRRSRSPPSGASSSRRCARSTAAAPSPSTPSTSTASRRSPTTLSGGSGLVQRRELHARRRARVPRARRAHPDPHELRETRSTTRTSRSTA